MPSRDVGKKIQRIPAGLQGFFELKGERLPSDLGDQLGAHLELVQWYLETAPSEHLVATVNAVGIAFFAPAAFVVPNGEVWYLSQASVLTAPLAATTLAGAALAVRRNTPTVSTNVVIGTSPPAVVGAAGATSRALSTLNRPIFLLPQDQLGWYVHTLTGAPIDTVELQAIITRLLL